MNVRERAKAYEDAVVRSSFVGESPPPRKKSREELIGYIDDNNSTEKRSPEDRPTPPPRKCKKKEEINKSNNSSPTTERKENIPEQIMPKQSDNAKSQSSVQQTTVTVRNKKQGPPPPPPPRGSSLGRNIKNPLSTQTTSVKKKERPPVPPKPKNYNPKVSPSGVNKVSTSSSNGGGFKTQRAESMPSERPSSQFFLGLEEQSVSLKSTKRQDAESKSQFFVAKAEPNLDDSSSRTETTKGLSNRKLSTETKERDKVLATENSKETSCVEHQEHVHVTPLKTRTQFTSYVVLTEQGNSAQETVDSLEGLEVHDVPLDYEDEDDNEMAYEEECFDYDEITDSQTVNGITETREANVVISSQDPDECPTQSTCNSRESSDVGVGSLDERTTTFEHATVEETFNNLSEQGRENQQLDEGISSLNDDSEEATSECLPAGETLLITSDNLGGKDFEEATEEEPAVSEQKGTIITDDLEEDLEQTAEEERVDVDEQLLTEETVFTHSNDHCQENPEEMLDDGIDVSSECMQLEEPVVMTEKQETVKEDLYHDDDQEDDDENMKVYKTGLEEEPMNLHVVAFEVQDKEVMTEDVDILETQAPVVAADESREECIAARLSVVDEHLSVSQQQSIANQEQSIDEVNTNTDEEPHPYIHVADRDDKDDIIIVAEPIKEGTLMTVSDDAVIDECTAGVYVAAEESTLLLPDKDVETVMKEGETEELETPFVGENEVEHDVLESEQENKNFSFAQMDSTALETQAQESDLKGVELEEQEGASDRNKLTELSEGGNLEKSDHEDQIHDNVVGEHETKTVVVSVCCKEVLQHESTEEAIASSTQETSQEALFEESQDAAVLHSGASDEVPEEGIIDAAVSVFQEGELPEVAEDERKSEPGSPVSPDPLRPERPNRQAKLQKHIYEEVGMSTQIEHQQVEETEYNSVPIISERRPLNSGYENVILAPVSHPLPPTNDNDDDESIYKVPTKVVSVESYLIDESEYSVPPRHLVIEDAEYAVPKPIVVQASQVTENTETDLEVYAVPGLATQVPVIETVQSAQSSNHGEVYAVPRENDNMYVVPTQHKTVTVTTVMVSAVPPPKPPRTSLSEENHKPPTQVIAEVQPTGSPKPVPRSRLANGSGTPEAVPRKGESPSPVPRKSSKTSQNDVDPSKTSVPSNGSPVPLPRSRVNAIESNTKESAASNGVTASLASNISTVDSEETEGTIKRSPPPRPPPPLSRVSVVGNDEEMPPLSPGFVDSDSDSDVGEEPVNKGPSKPKTYHIAHEILSTERTFVDALQLVNEECYGTIKSANVISESVLSDIFRDLENIYLLDSRFLQELEERMKTWEEHERIGDIVKKYGHFLKMYTTFVNGYDKAMNVFQETMKENTEFAKLVLDFQASERCHGMQLSAYMLKPVQRVPSYRLLLIDYLKHLPKDSEECKDTEAALKIVSEVATHINESMKKMDSFEQLLKLQRMLVGHPEIVKAGRDYLKEGTLMKLCRKDMQERMFFLLTDVLLYTTAVGVNQYKLNKMLPLLGMQVTVPDSPDLVNEFSIISTTRSFTLTASTPEERDKWVEDLNKAIDVVTKRKITFANKSKDATSSFEQDEDAKLGEKAPVWIPDARVTMCMSCTTPFNFTNRRHHCRACGKVICGSCSDCTAPLAYLDFEQTRVCDKCYELLLREFHTDEIHVDTETRPLPPLLQESENAEKLLKKPTKFEMTRRFRSKKTKKRKSHIMHPSHLTEVVGNEEGSQVSGYLRCKKGRTGWKKSWFVLKDRVLYAYKASSDVVALESIPVLGYEIQDLGKDEDDFLFNLKHKGITPLAFKADNEGSATRWIQELKKAVNLE